MSIQYAENGFGTSVFNKAMLFLVTTASSFANPFGHQPISGFLNVKANLCQNYKSSFLTMYDWEASLLGAQSTGGEWMFQKELSSYYKIHTFAQKFLSDLESTPPEFNAVFLENFWDTLA